MNIGFVLRLASKNMWRHRLRTGLTIAGIAIAIVSFGLLRTVVDSWYAGAALSSSARLMTRNEASLTFSLPVTDAERSRKIPVALPHPLERRAAEVATDPGQQPA